MAGFFMQLHCPLGHLPTPCSSVVRFVHLRHLLWGEVLVNCGGGFLSLAHRRDGSRPTAGGLRLLHNIVAH
jgi:hypothetical protein